MIVFNKIFFRKGKMRRQVKQIVEILSVCIEFRGNFIYLFIYFSSDSSQRYRSLFVFFHDTLPIIQ